MRHLNKGFTLIELLVVVLIMGILASISMPYYNKTVETSKATDSVALGHMLGNAYRMFSIDNPGVALSGQLTATCNDATACGAGDTSACRLVRCKYVAQQDWSNSSYNYFVGPVSCGANMVACTRRNGGNAPYSSWAYTFSTAGVCGTAGGGMPNCPQF